jgi:hypothetical protein
MIDDFEELWLFCISANIALGSFALNSAIAVSEVWDNF